MEHFLFPLVFHQTGVHVTRSLENKHIMSLHSSPNEQLLCECDAIP